MKKEGGIGFSEVNDGGPGLKSSKSILEAHPGNTVFNWLSKKLGVR